MLGHDDEVPNSSSYLSPRFGSCHPSFPLELTHDMQLVPNIPLHLLLPLDISRMEVPPIAFLTSDLMPSAPTIRSASSSVPSRNIAARRPPLSSILINCFPVCNRSFGRGARSMSKRSER